MRLFIITSALLVGATAYADAYTDVLAQVEKNSTALEAHRSLSEARKAANRVGLAPENPEVLYIMGKALFANAEYERSAQTLRRMTEAAPNSWHAYVLMALAYDKLRDDSRAYEAISCASAKSTEMFSGTPFSRRKPMVSRTSSKAPVRMSSCIFMI